MLKDIKKEEENNRLLWKQSEILKTVLVHTKKKKGKKGKEKQKCIILVPHLMLVSYDKAILLIPVRAIVEKEIKDFNLPELCARIS